ncbi:MAG: hypothetical protein U1C74_30210, partial [Phenylobacterium sp.]|nr:hypothetical protein [Phenylobacterium sp.]
MAGRKLKVFQAQFGFYDTVVAAPSQAAALRIWGVRRNLFASDDATVVTDERAIAAALAAPETILRRPVGSRDAFTVDPTGLPQVPDAPVKPAAKPATEPKAKRTKPRLVAKSKPEAKPRPTSEPRPAARAPPDRSQLDAAEAALAALDADRRREEAAFRQEGEDLDARRRAAQ